MKLIFITTCKPFDEEYSWKQEQSIKSWVLEFIEEYQPLIVQKQSQQYIIIIRDRL